MGFRCVNCGGNIVFDIDSQSMKCQHCGSMISPDQFEVRNSSTGEDISESELTLFTCGSCGAQLHGTEESQVGFCPYCGGQSLLQSKKDGKSMPERIIPFQVSKERCSSLFADYTKKVRYLPKELRNAAYLKSFTGIYMPYYEYDVELGASHIVGTKTVKSTSQYDLVNTYSIDASVDGDYCGVPYDASKYYDDEIAARVLPFDMKKEQPFRPAYLSGFYADASTVPAETYYEDAEKTASSDIVEEVSRLVNKQDGITVETRSSRVDALTRGHHSTMFPLWFLTWRKGDRVAYAVVNGESGKVVSDLPVDAKTFSLGCAAIALIVFLILELLVQPTPLLTSLISLVAAGLMTWSIKTSTKRIFEKQTHVKDKGWTGQKPPVVKQKDTYLRQTSDNNKAGSNNKDNNAGNKEDNIVGNGADNIKADNSKAGKNKAGKNKAGKINIAGFIDKFITVVGFLTAIILSTVIENMNLYLFSIITAITVVVYMAFNVVKILRWQRSIPQWRPSFAIVAVSAAAILNAAIIFIHPVDDFWYYLGDAVCILILVAASAVMLNVYNISTTRPLPRLFDREEVR